MPPRIRLDMDQFDGYFLITPMRLKLISQRQQENVTETGAAIVYKVMDYIVYSRERTKLQYQIEAMLSGSLSTDKSIVESYNQSLIRIVYINSDITGWAPRQMALD